MKKPPKKEFDIYKPKTYLMRKGSVVDSWDKRPILVKLGNPFEDYIYEQKRVINLFIGQSNRLNGNGNICLES